MISIAIQRLNNFLPFHKLIKLILFMAIGIQLIIITYNHLSGYNPINNTIHFLTTLIFGSILSTLAGLLVAIPDLFIIRYLNRSLQWNSRTLARLALQLCLTIILAIIVSCSVTLFSNWISAYHEQLFSVLIYNSLIFALTNIILMVILEAWLFFIESHKAKMKAGILEKELSQIRFEVLKSQINPHFMFNSLNVLSGLIDKDVVKAQQFIDEFSHIYRYVLETIEKQVVSLNDELSFVRSYIFLQQIRYGEVLTLSVDLPSDLLEMLLPPLSLQLVLENAIKHNVINQSQPLQIDIYHDKDQLIVRNNLQPKVSSTVSTGLGQKNLSKRYTMICSCNPTFRVESNHYVVSLPLIQSE